MGCPAIKYHYEKSQLSFAKGGLFEAKKQTKPYRFGFNGKEKDSEGMGGGLSTYDYGFRIYNPAIARFLSVDPLSRNFPWWTPYQFAGNTPIQAIDLDGLELLIPRLLPIPLEPIITIPKAPTIPLPPIPGEVIMPPLAPPIPNDLTVGQPQQATEFDWSKVDRKDVSTWPEPPVAGPLTEGDPSRKKPKERGEKSLYDENGGEWRPHVPDKYHPDGHWDYKAPGENSQWEDIYVVPEIIVTPTVLPKTQQTAPAEPKRNWFQRKWDQIKKWYKEDLERRQRESNPNNYA